MDQQDEGSESLTSGVNGRVALYCEAAVFTTLAILLKRTLMLAAIGGSNEPAETAMNQARSAYSTISWARSSRWKAGHRMAAPTDRSREQFLRAFGRP